MEDNYITVTQLSRYLKYKMDNANYLIAQTELEKMKTEIMKNITDNYFTAKTKEEIIDAKNKQVLTTKEGLRQAIARLKIGEATYLDVIEANNQKTVARIELINAIINFTFNKRPINLFYHIP